MINKEVVEVFKEMRNRGMSDEQILNVLFLMFKDGKLSVKELKMMADILGYDLSPNFIAVYGDGSKDKKKRK